MSNPSKDPKFNAAIKKMIAAKPTQNKDLKVGPKIQPKAHKKPKPWPWDR